MAGTALVLGAMAWMAKLGVIVATDGRVTDTGPAATAFVAGAALLAVGAGAAGLHLASRRGALGKVVGVVLGLVSFFVLFGVVGDALGSVLVGVGPSYVQDEVGILLAALVGLSVGILVLRRPSAQGDLVPATR